MFGRVFGGATAYPKAKGVWRDDERRGAGDRRPVVVHCHTTPEEMQEVDHLAELGRFCRRMGREAVQGEVGLVIGDEYFAFQQFDEEWSMKSRLDMDKIAKGLGADRRGKIAAKSGHFGGLQLLADVKTRFRTPARGGGRLTDRTWTERRLIPLAPRTLRRLERIAARLRADGGVSLQPMQLAGLLLEKSTEGLDEKEAERLVSSSGASR